MLEKRVRYSIFNIPPPFNSCRSPGKLAGSHCQVSLNHSLSHSTIYSLYHSLIHSFTHL